MTIKMIMKNTSHSLDINRPRSRRILNTLKCTKYTKYKKPLCKTMFI